MFAALKQFAAAFYEYSQKYKAVTFDGDYNYKSKRIARIFQKGYIALGDSVFTLSLKIKNMDAYSGELAQMPESVTRVFTKDYCRHCDFQGAAKEHCKFRIHWTFAGKAHKGCAHQCFEFDDFSAAIVPEYRRLLELEFRLA